MPSAKSEMKPGRELDALVAEKVMGWKDCKVHPDPKFAAAGLCGLKPNRLPNPIEWGIAPVPHHSTDIKAAWEVVEKLKGKELSHLTLTYWPVPDEWSCEDAQNEDNPKIGAVAKTAPHAICLAALKAVGYTL